MRETHKFIGVWIAVGVLSFSGCNPLNLPVDQAVTIAEDETAAEDESAAEDETAAEDESASPGTDTSPDADVATAEITPFELPTLAVQLPVDESEFIVSSAFGPRLEISDDYRYDFHRGIDIPGEHGQDILAIAVGTIYAAYPEGSPQYPNGGNVVVIRHDLTTPVSFNGISVTRLYSLYLHLDSFGQAAQDFLDSGAQDAVAQGEVIGTMGNSGPTDFTHLHLEIRMQTTCSFKYQLENPDQDCADYGIDPHVNPMAFFVAATSADLGIAITAATLESVTIVASASRGTLLLDGMVFEIFADADLITPVYRQLLSFNLRAGFDASSTATLDDNSLAGFTLSPAVFSDETEVYEFTFEALIPATIRDTAAVFRATAYDVFGNTTSVDGEMTE